MTTTPTTSTPAERIAAALAAHPGATTAELAEMTGIGRSTAAKTLASLEQNAVARRSPGGREGGRRLPDRWHPADADTAAPEPAGSEEDEQAPAREGGGATAAGPVEAGASRLGKGALRSLVFDYLSAHAGPDGLGPTAIAKGIGGRSSGAVGNALQRLEADGRVHLVSESPRRYRPAE